jgi:uncharacterized membrane protein YbaN (DUF454 family)
MKILRLIAGVLLIVLGILLTILPGSTFLLLAGLMLLSIDFPPAKRMLKKTQRGMSAGARKLDSFLAKKRKI